MAITTLDGYIGSAKQFARIAKTAARTTVATGVFSVIDVAGTPGAGVLAGTSQSVGVVPVAGDTGFPPLNAFGSGNTGYLTNVDFGNSVACRLSVYDLLWKGGAYAFNVSTSGNTPTSFASRIPGGDYKNTEIWLEQVTAGTGVQNVAVTYINQDGTTGRSTGTVATQTNILGRMHRLPLQTGDSGVQGITGVVGSVSTAGTFNILVLRQLWSGRVRIANDGDVHALDKTGMPVLYQDSALFLTVCADSTSGGIPEVFLEIAAG